LYPQLLILLLLIQTGLQHTSFSKVDPFTLVAAQIRSGPLFLSEHIRDEIEAIGKADLLTSFLSFDATVELIKLVRNHVSVVVSHCQPLMHTISYILTSRGRVPRIDQHDLAAPSFDNAK